MPVSRLFDRSCGARTEVLSGNHFTGVSIVALARTRPDTFSEAGINAKPANVSRAAAKNQNTVKNRTRLPKVR